MDFLQNFLQENRHLTLLSTATEEARDMMLWANKKRYITLTVAPTGELCFTDHDIECARMWHEKEQA